jgi:hypothetical protein
MLGCHGAGKVRKLAEIVAATVLRGEISLGSAIVSDEGVDLVVAVLLSRSHAQHRGAAYRCLLGIGPGDRADLTPEAARCCGQRFLDLFVR